MQNTSALYDEIYASDNHWFEVALAIGESGRLIDEFADVLYFGNTAILVDSGGASTAFREDILMSLSTKHAVFNENYPVVGSAVSGEIDIQMIKPTSDIPRMARLVPFVRITDGVRYSEWLQKGVYYVDTRETSHNSNGLDIVTIHGYDAMLKFEEDYPSDSQHDYPLVDTEIVQLIANSVNISVDARTWERMNKGYEFPLPIGYSSREVLGIIAASYGGNFIISDEGQLLLIRLSDLPRETNYLITTLGDIVIFGTEHGGSEQTLTGDVITFNNDQGYIVDELTTAINPAQDLHGYDSPWPAGGGKNKLSPVAYTGASYNMNTGVTLTLTESPTQPTINGNTITWTIETAWVGLSFRTGALKSGTYTTHLDVTDTPGRRLTFYVVGSDNVIKEKAPSSSYNVENRTFTVDDNDYVVVFCTMALTGTMKLSDLQTESGSSFTTFAPYSNICPISGHSAANVTRTGKNVFTATGETNGSYLNENGVIASGSGWMLSDYIPVAPSTQYTFNPNSTEGYSAKSWYFDANKVGISAINSGQNTFTTPNNCYFMRFSYRETSTNIQLELGSSASTYESFSGTTIPISFGSTIYGGTLDVTAGTLTVDRAYIEFDGSNDEQWAVTQTNGHYRAYIAVEDILPWTVGHNDPSTNYICDCYENSTWGDVFAGEPVAGMVNSNFGVGIDYLGITGYDAWRAHLSSNPIHIAYVLATPTVITLTPTEVQLLLGTNNVWSNTGSSTIKIVSQPSEPVRILV